MRLVFRDYGGEPDKKVGRITIHGEDVFKVVNDNWRVIEVYREEDLDVYVIKIANMYDELRCTKY